jgi:4-amino-4-deoxy-L-arabinose transferase-like glycosyltransferase
MARQEYLTSGATRPYRDLPARGQRSKQRQKMGDRSHLLRAGLLLTLTVVLYFVALGREPFHGSGEPREAVEVQEEISRGDWILPMRNGIELPSKPPLFHWLAGLSALAQGRVDEWTVRLPSAVLATLAVLALYVFAAWRWDVGTAVYAAAALATSFEWMRAARSARVDMTLNAFLVGALIAFGGIADAEQPPTGGTLLFALCVGMAALAKGPLALIVPMLVAVAYLGMRGRLGRWCAPRTVLLLAPAVAIPTCWYLLAIWKGGEAFVHKQILVENLQTFVEWTGDPGTPKHSFLYFVPALLAGFTPWSPVLLFAAARLWTMRGNLQRQGLLYPLVWFGVVFVFFTVAAGKRSVYLLPAYPAGALLVGWWWGQLSAGKLQATVAMSRVLRLAGAMALAAGLVAITAIVAEAFGAAPLELLRPFLHHKDQANLALVRGIVQKHTAVVMLWAIASTGTLGVFAAAAYRRAWPVVFGAIVVFVAAGSLLVNGVVEPELADRWTPKPLVATIRATVKGQDELGFYRTFDYGVVFYWGDRIPVVSGTISEIRRQGRPRYLLLWESDWKALTAADRETLEIISRGNHTGSDEPDRLVFARARPVTETPRE